MDSKHLRPNKRVEQEKTLREGTSILEFIANEREKNREFIKKQKKEEFIREVKREGLKLLLTLPIFAFYMGMVHYTVELFFKIHVSFFELIIFSVTILWFSWLAFLVLRGLWPKIFFD